MNFGPHPTSTESESLGEGLLVKLCFHSPQLTQNHLRSLNIELTEVISTKDLPPAEHQKYYSTWV